MPKYNVTIRAVVNVYVTVDAEDEDAAKDAALESYMTDLGEAEIIEDEVRDIEEVEEAN